MNTIGDPGSSTGSAAAATRKCALALTANVSSHCAALVPAIPRPSPIPTFSTRPSSPSSAAADSVTTAAHASGDATSASTTAARCPSPRTRAAVASAAPTSRSAQATAAPSRPASTEMARPFPIGGARARPAPAPAPPPPPPPPRSRPRARPRPPDGGDGDLGEPPLDRGVEPQRRAERGQPAPGARRGDERVERPGQAALGGHQQVTPAVDDAVPQLLALGPQFLAPHIRNPGHQPTIAGALVNSRFSVSTGPRYSAASLKKCCCSRHGARSPCLGSVSRARWKYPEVMSVN